MSYMPLSKDKNNKNPKTIFFIVLIGVCMIVILTISFVKIVNGLKFGFGPTGDNKLLIIKSPWTGWSVKQPRDEKSVIDISKNSKVDLGGIEKSYLYIESFDDQKIYLTVTNLSVKQGDELKNVGINLNGCGMHTFTLKKGEMAELNTCSMDVGTTWTVKY